MSVITRVEIWGGRGLRSLSGVMAVFCGLATVLLGALLIGSFANAAIAMATGQPVNWSLSSKGGSVHGDFKMRQITVCSPRPGRICPTASSARRLNNTAPLIAGLVAAQAPMAALVYGLSQACLCFIGMARGRFLHRKTASRLTRFAAGGLVFVLACPFSGAIGGAAAGLTYRLFSLLTGQKTLFFFSSVGASYSGISGPLTALYAVILTVIAIVLIKASIIADDHAQIV